MSISRREFGVLGAAALAFRARHANAGERDVFVFGQDLPANLDPHHILDLGMTGYALNTYDNLYRYEDNPPKMQPWLAISHTSSPDGLVWDFKLRQGVKFHDGSELAADDVVYSVQRLLGIGRAPAAPFLPILKPESVNAPDRYTVRFTLDRPYGPFFGMIPMVFIVNPRAVKPHEEAGDWGARWLASNEAGSGAYRLIPSSYLPLEHADVEKYDDHFYGWRENSQAIKKVEWRAQPRSPPPGFWLCSMAPST
jgi:peptide/nickel transport system substrate-binding protein